MYVISDANRKHRRVYITLGLNPGLLCISGIPTKGSFSLAALHHEQPNCDFCNLHNAALQNSLLSLLTEV